MTRVLAVVTAIAAIAGSACSRPQESEPLPPQATQQPVSVQTSIARTDCTMPQADVMAPYLQKDLGVEQCPAPAGWRVLLVSSDSNSWIDVAGPEGTWSGERPIVYDAPIGNFPSVGDPPTLEWRRTGNRQVTALIVPVTAQNRETFQTDQTAFYVVRFEPGGACVVGRPATLEAARTLADTSEGC